jgi:hypothetical protein
VAHPGHFADIEEPRLRLPRLHSAPVRAEEVVVRYADPTVQVSGPWQRQSA